jgi:hypothetical protein
VKARASFVAVILAVVPTSVAHAEEDPSRVGSGTFNAESKDVGLHSPRGRRIYRSEAELGGVVDSRRRIFVIEAAAGAGPEGNLGIVLGWMPKAIHGLEFYGGAGFEINPAIHVTGAARFLFNICGYRPYLALGYFYKDAYAIETFTHHVFLEGGYSLKLGPTNHLSLGLGVARLLYTGVRNGSPLRTREVDQTSLAEQIDSLPPYLPMFVARFSRAF